MSRILLGATCALLVLVGFVLSGRLGAEQEGAVGGDATARFEGAVQSAEERIDAVLNAKLKAPLDFVDTPLRNVVDHLQEEYAIPIIFDNAALDEVAISTDTELNATLSNITLRSVLELIFRKPGLEDLTYIIDKEVLLITTQDRANETSQVKVYRTDDFEHFAQPKSESESKKDCYSSLLHVIVSCVEFDSWQENGTGEGEIHLMKPGLLVVSQTRSVHRKIEELLADLREVKAEIEGSSSGSGNF